LTILLAYFKFDYGKGHMYQNEAKIALLQYCFL